MNTPPAERMAFAPDYLHQNYLYSKKKAPFTQRGQVGEEVDVRRYSLTDEAVKCSIAVDRVAEIRAEFLRCVPKLCDRPRLFFLSWDQSRPNRIVGLPGHVTS